MRNYWWICSQTVINALNDIVHDTPHQNPLINSGAKKFMQTDGMTHLGLFKSVSKDAKTWQIANVYGVTQEEVDAYLAEWPNDIEMGGCWERDTGAALCPQSPDLLSYMPDDCHAYDQDGNCTDWQPAAALKQVVMLPPQTHRIFAS